MFLMMLVAISSFRHLVILGLDLHDLYAAHSRLMFLGALAIGWVPLLTVQGHLFLHVRHFKLRAGRTDDLPCPECGFNLHGNRSGRCPECGEKFDRNEVASYWKALSRLGKPWHHYDP